MKITDRQTLLKNIASSRYSNIRRIQRLAKKHGRCEEQYKGRCRYPHCGCLHGKNGPIDPVTGKETDFTGKR